MIEKCIENWHRQLRGELPGGFASVTVNQNVVPRCSTLSQPISPPISSTNCREIASPRPVPP